MAAVLLLSGLTGCVSGQLNAQRSPEPRNTPTPIASVAAAAESIAPPKRLQESWDAYRQRFVQTDGRVIDWESDERTTSEGQAYAMLRAVFMDDPVTFARTLKWAEDNLRRQGSGKLEDHLWVWKWGKDDQKKWVILDRNFASDADIDAATALILAARRWNRPDYLKLAQVKLQDIWDFSTIDLGGQRYLLPGPRDAFQRENQIILNPSYLAPYSFRLFTQVDPDRDWMSLVRSSYQVLEQSAQLSAVYLPSDWVALDVQTGQYAPVTNSDPLVSQHSFDAYRVWWRVAWDAIGFNAPEATDYLRRHLGYLQQTWQAQGRIPAVLDLQGSPTVEYEATSQYGALYVAFRLVDPDTAEQIYRQKLDPQYRSGFWDNNAAYYTQNIVWLGLLPSTTVSSRLLTPTNTAQETRP